MSVWIGMTGGLANCWGEKGAASYRSYTGLLQSPHSYVLMFCSELVKVIMIIIKRDSVWIGIAGRVL